MAQGIELQTLAHPVEQLDIELLFQVLEGTAGRGLGHGQLVRGAADILGVGGGEEHFQLAQGVFHGWGLRGRLTVFTQKTRSPSLLLKKSKTT